MAIPTEKRKYSLYNIKMNVSAESNYRYELPLKGQCHEIFCFWFFSWISFPQAPEYTIRAVSNFFKNSRRYSQLKVDHRYQWHRWQICHWCQRYRRQIFRRCQWHRGQTMRLISGWGYLKVNLKAKIYKYVNSTIQRCPNKIIKIFLIEDFFHLPPVSDIGGQLWAANISANLGKHSKRS